MAFLVTAVSNAVLKGSNEGTKPWAKLNYIQDRAQGRMKVSHPFSE